MPQDPASFRDPAGHVHHRDGRVYRSVLPAGQAQYSAAKRSGFLDAAVKAGLLIEGREVAPGVLQEEASDAAYVLEHPRLAFISYPYEWSFSGLQAAALLTLDLLLAALQHDLTLSDASAYNVQFVGARPLFIDYLSIIPYQPGQVWLGYRQFCEQFLNPLLLSSKTGVGFQAWYRGSLEGVPSVDLAALLPLRARLDPRVALHVLLQGRLQRGASERQTARAGRARLSRTAFENNLRAMRAWVAALKPRYARAPWTHYERSVNYTPDERAAKARFVAEGVAAGPRNVVWDLGCNSGEYAEVALSSGAGEVVGFETDPGALDAAYRRAVEKDLRFLPLAVDAVNPSPSSGWRERERRGLADRSNADVVLALALLHHLVLGRNLPLAQAVEWLCALAPRGIIEFVPKEDPKARQLLALKPDVAPEYDRETVARLLQRHGRIERELQVTASGRVLFAYARA